MRAPPDIQVASILYWLGTALRQDTEIQKWTGAAPGQIVAQTAEYIPLSGSGGKMNLLTTQLPALCLSIISERVKVVPGTKRGREFRAWLWYIFPTFQSKSKDVHGFTMGQRLCTLIWWRVQHWLAYQTIPIGDTYGPSFDLQAISKIRLLRIDGSSERVALEKYEAIKIPLTVWHGWAPYEEVPPATLDLIELGIQAESGTGLEVEADVDVT